MTELAVLEPPDTSDIETEANEIVARAEAFIVDSAPNYETAGRMVLAFKEVVRRIGDTLDPVVKKAHEAHKALTALRNERTEPFKQAEARLKSKMAAYQRAEQERVRREQEEARRKAEAEQRERDRQAEELRQAGQKEAAEAYVAATPLAPAPVVTPEVPKVKGVSTRKSWTYTIVDEAKLPRQYLVPDHPAIRAAVKSLGKRAEQTIPGIEVTEETTIVGRTG